jgi:hypothetical protein
MMDAANKENGPEARGMMVFTASKTFGAPPPKPRRSLAPLKNPNVMANPMVNTQSYKKSPRSQAIQKSRALAAQKIGLNQMLASTVEPPTSPSKRKSMIGSVLDQKKRKLSILPKADLIPLDDKVADLLKPSWKPTRAAPEGMWTMDQVTLLHNMIEFISCGSD